MKGLPVPCCQPDQSHSVREQSGTTWVQLTRYTDGHRTTVLHHSMCLDIFHDCNQFFFSSPTFLYLKKKNLTALYKHNNYFICGRSLTMCGRASLVKECLVVISMLQYRNYPTLPRVDRQSHQMTLNHILQSVFLFQ